MHASTSAFPPASARYHLLPLEGSGLHFPESSIEVIIGESELCCGAGSRCCLVWKYAAASD